MTIIEGQTDDIVLIDSPSDFISLLREKIRNSNHQVLLSALYLGDGGGVKELVEELHQAISKRPSLQISIILDYNRWHRDFEKSISALGELSSFWPQFQLFLHKVHRPSYVPNLKSHNYFSTIYEILGVYHCKYAVVDNDVIVTGANLSENYFKDRQDRYVEFRNAHNLAKYLASFHQCVIKQSYKLQHDGSLVEPLYSADLLVKDLTSFITTDYPSIFYKQTIENNLSNKSSKVRSTYLIPTIQYRSLGINQEEDLITTLFQQPFHWLEMTLCTPYPSFTSKFASAISNFIKHTSSASDAQEHRILDSSPRRPVSLDFLVPSESSHGFADGEGIRSLIPKIHRQAFEESLEAVLAPLARAGRTLSLSTWFYERPGWTFHAKGLWLTRRKQPEEYPKAENPDEQRKETSDRVMYTYIGSSNLSERSWNRDFELGFLVATDCPRLQGMLETERRRLLSHSKHHSRVVAANLRMHEPPFRSSTTIRLLTRVCRYLNLL